MITGNEPISAITGFQGQIFEKFNSPFIEDGAVYSGLTIRQYYAGLAMQGILSNSEFIRNHQDIDIHKLAVANADDLITELNKEKL